jgi:DNA-binding protein H-NS
MAKKKSMDELLAQRAKIEDEIASLERQRAMEVLGKSSEVRAVAKQITKLGLNDDEIVLLFRGSAKPAPKQTRKQARKPRSSAKKTAPSVPVATYQHPEDPNTTWSGRGRKPGWIIEWVESGKPVEELRKG